MDCAGPRIVLAGPAGPATGVVRVGRVGGEHRARVWGPLDIMDIVGGEIEEMRAPVRGLWSALPVMPVIPLVLLVPLVLLTPSRGPAAAAAAASWRRRR